MESAISAEQIGAVQQALDEMDDALLRPLVLRYFGDLNSGEIGEILEMPASTVRAALRQGRIALARALMKRGIAR
jgi:RNA polymerase sigma-70 factor (ECF subfamily)